MELPDSINLRMSATAKANYRILRDDLAKKYDDLAKKYDDLEIDHELSHSHVVRNALKIAAAAVAREEG